MLIKKDKDIIISYLEDYSNLKGGFAETLAIPESESDIISFLKEASSQKIPVTISGAGTGVCASRIPFGGAVLSMEKLNKIISIVKKPADSYAVIEPGVRLEDFLKAVQERGLFYPPDPTEKSSFIGANVSTGASGARTFKFGATRDFVKRLRIVLSSGRIIDLKRGQAFAEGHKLSIPTTSGDFLRVDIPEYKMPGIKNAAGYYASPGMDAIDLFIGQDGTLGVISQIELKLLQMPPGIFNCYAFFKKDEDCLKFIYQARSSMDAMSIEYFDPNALNLLRGKHPEIPDDAASACFFEQIADKANEDSLINEWAGLMKNHNADIDKAWFGQSRKDIKKFHDFRHDIPETVNEIIKKTNRIKVGTDIAVPDDRLDEMVHFYKSNLEKSKISHLMFGHIGNSHLHVNMLPENDEEQIKAKSLFTEFVKKAVSLGGTVSAEHGIGKTKHGYLKIMYGESGLLQMARLKKQLDPACVLGLDNVFPKELLLRS